jgi:hypothetical protein
MPIAYASSYGGATTDKAFWRLKERKAQTFTAATRFLRSAQNLCIFEIIHEERSII